MADLIIVEGARGTYKSHVCRKVRDKVNYSTLINFTGFPDKGQAGLQKVCTYYSNWMNFFESLKGQNMTFICDRIFFSEMVYSTLYKDYDFTTDYKCLLNRLYDIVDHLSIFHLTLHNEDEFSQRLIRDKVPFGEAKESVRESLRQQVIYSQLFRELPLPKDLNRKFLAMAVPTDGKTSEEVAETVISFYATY